MTQYTTGTVAVGQGSATVAGSGTGWLAAGVAPGWAFVGPDGRTYGVSAVASATGLTLDRAYEGRTATGAAYALVEGQPAAGASSVPWPGDSNDSISRPAAGQIAFRTAGVQRALLTATAFSLSVPVTGTAVIQGLYDTTVGRLMTAGAGGLLLAPGNYPAEYDFASWGASPSGFYWYNNVGDAGPTGLGYGSVIAFQYAASRQHRIVLDADARRMFIGYLDSAGVQSPWSEIYGQRNSVGTVSQSGGVPTGALIETGVNANGRYVRFADGTQICWQGIIASAAGGTTWTFPAPFAAGAAVTGSVSAPVIAVCCFDVSPSATAVTFSVRDKTDARRADTCFLLAIGRWF